jgi:hypothetical protein
MQDIDSKCRFLVVLHAWELDHQPPPDHILEDPDFDTLRTLSAEQIILVNDMYSFRKEAFGVRDTGANDNADSRVWQECQMFNAVCILFHEDGVDETNVMDRLGAHIRRKESDFIHTAEKLKERYKDRVDDLDVIQLWIGILTQWMAGHYFWSTICRRYNKLDDFLDNSE